MIKRGTWLIVGAALALFALAYVGSPFWAARQFKQAALSADVDRIEKAVDFPAVRESLKAQLTPALTQTMQSDPDLRANPFTGLGLMMMPAIIGKMVDAVVTPEAISAMMKSGRVVRRQTKASTHAKVDYTYGYRDLDHFAVTALAADTKADDAPTFVFERRGLLAWKLVRIEVPAAALTRWRK